MNHGVVGAFSRTFRIAPPCLFSRPTARSDTLSALSATRRRVVEFIGEGHDEDACVADCVQEHVFCYVRVPPSRSTAPRSKWGRRRLDLAVDLQPALRVLSLDALLAMGEQELADAWLLLEPREDDDDVEVFG